MLKSRPLTGLDFSRPLLALGGRGGILVLFFILIVKVGWTTLEAKS